MSHRSLTHPEAVARAFTVRKLSYELDVDLTGGPDTFRTVTTIRFAAEAGASTFVEVRPERLIRASLNGVPLDGQPSEGRLELAGLATDNIVVVEGQFAYSHSSQGMHRFADPADGAVYIYAQPSITHAPDFMAVFDQPDLKASVSLSVTADPTWIVRSNREGEREAPGRWTFPATEPIATYLITLIAGPFVERRDSHDGIPLGLIARASYEDVLEREAPEIFETTKAFLDRFHELFEVRYPFGKYDQAFVPEFSWSAMEFPGCVILRDEYLFRGAVTDTDRLTRATLIAHEMAHMWFGDLVTMRWWDDLWLNESFATYMGYRLTEEVTRWKQAWTRFGVDRKVWGYAADQRPSTHPVAPVDVQDTDAAFANFDGISYSKGCSALRQLVAWIGDEAFFGGLRDYFDKHAWGNATLADLLAALSRASGRDIQQWARLWLRTPQVNTLRPVITWTADGAFENVSVRQTAPAEHPTLRPHRIAISWRDGGGQWRRTDAQIAGALTPVPGLSGVMGEGLLLNDDDLTFAKVRMDERSRMQLADLIKSRPETLSRALMWNSAWDATRDGEWGAQEFIELVAAALPSEPDVIIVESVFGLARTVAVPCYLPLDRYQEGLATLARTSRSILDDSEAGGGRQLAAARALVSSASRADVPWLRDWLRGVGVPDGLVIDSDLRWSVLGRLCVVGDVGEAEIEDELTRDHSAQGKWEATKCRASRPDAAAKAQAFDLVVIERGLSYRIVTSAGEGLWQPEHAALTSGYVERFFTELPRSPGRSGKLLATVALAAYPDFEVSERTLALGERALAGDLHPLLRRALLDKTDDLRRSLVVRRASG